MGNRARNRLKLFPESESLGIIPKKSKTTALAVLLCLNHDLSVLELLSFASLFLEIQDLPTVHLELCHLVPRNWRSSHSSFVIFLDQFTYIYFQRWKLFCEVSGPQNKYKNFSLQTIWITESFERCFVSACQ